MPLYLTHSDPAKRHDLPIYYHASSQWNRFVSDNLPFAQSQSTDEAMILDFVSHRIEEKEVAFELLLQNEDCTRSLLSSLSSLLLDKDASIGLLLQKDADLQSIFEISDSLGIAYPKAKPAKILCKKPCGLFRLNAMAALSMPVESAGAPGKIELEESFHDRLIRYLNLSEKTNAEVYRKGGISKQVFSKVLSDKDMIPTKQTILCLIIGMHLDLEQARLLLLSAGYALSNSIALDAVFIRHLRKGDYDLLSINNDLDANHCPLLGWHPRD